MALEAALYYTDAQGIKGDNTITARADSSEILQLDHEVFKPTDSQTGRPTGARVHGPMKILKRIDKASPLLFKALTQNQDLPELEIRWYRPDPTGSAEIQHFYSIILKNVMVSKIQEMLPNTIAPDEAYNTPSEWVSFNYRSIEWTYQDGGITHVDEWTERNV